MLCFLGIGVCACADENEKTDVKNVANQEEYLTADEQAERLCNQVFECFFK